MSELMRLAERLERAFGDIQQQKRHGTDFSLQPLWDIVNTMPKVVGELRAAASLEKAVREHDRFNREDLGYSGPDDPSIDPACGEDWQRLLNALRARAAEQHDTGKDGE